MQSFDFVLSAFWLFTVDFRILCSAFELWQKKKKKKIRALATKFVSLISFKSYVVHKLKVLGLSSLFACVALAFSLNCPMFEHVLSVFFFFFFFFFNTIRSF